MRGMMTTVGILGLLTAAPARAATLEVCDLCGYTTIADALAAAQGGDDVEVGAGLWQECGSAVPDGVHLAGAGREDTILDASACIDTTALLVGDDASVTDLSVLPEPATGTGVLFGGAGSLDRVDVRGGLNGLVAAPLNTAGISVARTLVALDAPGALGIAALQGSWSLDHVTLVQTAGQDGVAVQAVLAPDLSIEESLLVGWGAGILPPAAGCTVTRTWFWDIAGDESTGCSEGGLLPNRSDLDPGFVDGADAALGDFHLRSTAGQWTPSGFVAGASDSPAVDAAHYDPAGVQAEADRPCNLPNLGAYGGTARASRSWATTCPVTDTTAGQGFASLVEAAASLTAGGHVLQIRDGDVDAGVGATFEVGAVIEAAPSANPRLSSTGTLAFFQLPLFPSNPTEEFTLRGLTLAAGDHVVWANTYGTSTITLQDVAVQRGRALELGHLVPSSSAADVTVTVLDSTFGTEDEPLEAEAFYMAAPVAQFSFDGDGIVAHSSANFIQFYAGSGYNLDHLGLTRSVIHTDGSAIITGGGLSPADFDIDIHASALLVGSYAVNSGQVGDTGNCTISNSLIFSRNSSGLQLAGSTDGTIMNSAVIGADDYGLDYEANTAVLVQNSLFGNTNVGIHANNGTPSPFLVQYNGFWNNATDASFPLDAINQTPCDPGYPLPVWPIDPLDFLGPLAPCAIDAGNPSASYNDADGTRNDLGPTGGPGGPDFLSLFDLDGDGHAGSSDCDDTDPTVYVGAPDLCGDGVDSDCSGGDAPDADADGFDDADCASAALPADCDDTSAAVHPSATDLSCDGIDQDCDGADQLDADGDTWRCDDGDCEDTEPSVHPGAIETCDGHDTDCDGAPGPDEVDADGDGYLVCTVDGDLAPGLLGGDDCDDGAAAVHPAAPELCDGFDDDCDGSPGGDEVDGDGDGYLACSSAAPDLAPGLLGGDDCNDVNANVYPGSPELCDGFDNDCDGSPEVGSTDADGDGVAICDGDCDDTEPAVHPGAPELCDGLDDDCDGAVPADELDADGDQHAPCDPWLGAPPLSGGDCDDADPGAYPSAPEACDGVDQACDGDVSDELDDDGDGLAECEGDCDDAEPAVYAGATELCDGLDNDCDGTELCDGLDNDCDGLDNNCDGFTTPGEVDADGDGVLACAGDCDDASGDIAPDSPELCDGLDNDCDPATTAVGGEEDADQDGSLSCDDCDDQDPARSPTTAERCDGLDNDCDGAVPDDELDGDGDGFAQCGDPADPLRPGGDCAPLDPDVHPSADEVCDGGDNDCDGLVDDADPDVVDPLPWYPDLDLDGFGDGDAAPVAACSAPDGHVPDHSDCDDAHADTRPDVPAEFCDGRDDNCDGDLSETERDDDGDGWISCPPDPTAALAEGLSGGGDCDDDAPSIHPSAPELCDGLDSDCDGVVPEDERDADADGQSPCEGDCDDGDRTTYDRAPELCDTLDNDCVGGPEADEVDADGDGWLDCDESPGVILDGYLGAGDCDDANPAVNPGAEEVCSGLDDDCDGVGDPPDCLSTPLPAPGCAASCSATPRGSGMPLLLLIVALRRRRA